MTIPWIDPVAVMALVVEGVPYRTVAERLGISRTRVGQIARQHGHNAAEIVARRAEERLLAAVDRQEAKGSCPAVPAWVSAARLTEDYRDHARDFGEHAAARHCRQLLAEMRRAA